MITSLPLLLKSNEMMQRLLKRFSIREVLMEQSDFFIAYSGAEMIVIFVRQEADYAEFVFEKDEILSSLIKRYNLHKSSSSIAQALSNALSGFTQQTPFRHVNVLCPVLKGAVADRSCREFADSSAFREAYLFPLQLQSGKQIGVWIDYRKNICVEC